MPRYRYEAVDRSGIPIHGTLEAADERHLSAQLEQRSQKLVSSEELSLDSLVSDNQSFLPRLIQLRLGEQLREAMLTGLPAHDAVRAIANEPLSSPMVGVMPWLYAMVALLLLFFGGIYQLTGQFFGVIAVLTCVLLLAIPLLHMVVKWMYEVRPRQILLQLARRLESGAALNTGLASIMPGELRAVMKSDVSDDAKARVATELMPRLMSGRLKTQQFIASFIGPLVLCSFVVAGLHALLLTIVPRFKAIFSDFGIELPVLTEMIVSLADLVGIFGVAGWVTSAIALAAGLLVLSTVLASIKGGEVMESIPLFGISFRWAMQARVARVLAAMIRQDCPYPEAIRAATTAGGFNQVRTAGEAIAAALNSGESQPPLGTASKLSGLPISMLFGTTDSADHKDRKAAIASTFQGLSEMLDSASVGQSFLFSTILQWTTVVFMGIIIGFTVLALFLPLIKLLNDLS